LASFDIIETSGKAYITAWEERQYLLRLALLPFIVKAAFFGVVLIMGYENNIIRQTLLMLPAYFFEGWLVAHIARFAFLGERGPVLSGQVEKDIPYLADRGRALFAAILFYVLIKMAQSALMAPLFQNEEEFREMAQQGEPSFVVFLVTTLLMMGFIWAFKYMFVHIPVAVHIPVKEYGRRLPGISSSLYLLGAWLTCYVPFIMVGVVLLKLLAGLLGGQATIFVFIVFLIHFAIDLAALSVVTLCFSFALRQVMTNDKPEI
jgi:hypothetical protein